MQANQTLKTALAEIIKDSSKIDFSVFESKVAFDFRFKGERAKQQARISAIGWWNRINEYTTTGLYFEVSCSWLDPYNEAFLEKVSSHNFPHKIKPQQATPIEGEQRL